MRNKLILGVVIGAIGLAIVVLALVKEHKVRAYKNASDATVSVDELVAQGGRGSDYITLSGYVLSPEYVFTAASSFKYFRDKPATPIGYEAAFMPVMSVNSQYARDLEYAIGQEAKLEAESKAKNPRWHDYVLARKMRGERKPNYPRIPDDFPILLINRVARSEEESEKIFSLKSLGILRRRSILELGEGERAALSNQYNKRPLDRLIILDYQPDPPSGKGVIEGLLLGAVLIVAGGGLGAWGLLGKPKS
jgi:hypothetical protein